METRSNESWFFSAIADKAKSLTSVKGLSKFFLLTFTLSALFLQNISSVNAQGSSTDTAIKMVKMIDMKGSGYDKLFLDYARNRQIYTYHKGVITLRGKDVAPGGNVVFYDTLTDEAVVVEALRNAKHVTQYENKLFYVIDKVNIYSYDLATGEVNFLLKASDQIISFQNTPDGEILVNALNGGSSNVPYAIGSVSRVAIFDTKDSNFENITDAPNVYQAVPVGNTVVYAESAYWFGTLGTGPSFRLNIYDRTTGKTYSETNYNGLGLIIKNSDSTFLIGFGPMSGGSDRLAQVNVKRDLHDLTFNKKDLFEIVRFTVPPIVGDKADPKSPEKNFLNNEVLFSGNWYTKNLITGVEVNRGYDETYAMDLVTFKETYIGKIFNPYPSTRFNFANRVDSRIIMVNEVSGVPYVNNLYTKPTTNIVKNVVIPGVSVYPNPANGVTNINVPNEANVEVYSAQGQLTFSQRVFDNAQVPVNIGINIVKITLGNSTQIIKVIGY